MADGTKQVSLPSPAALFVGRGPALPGARVTLRQACRALHVPTAGAGLYPVTSDVLAFVAASLVGQGLLTVFCRHTSASLLIQENADPDVAADLLGFFARLAPACGVYRHDAEGPDDMPAHLRAALTQVHLSIPVADGRPLLGRWQGIFLFEHRAARHRRELALHVMGDAL